MKRIEQLLRNERFCKELHQIEEQEQNRIYCGHNLAHLLDVARISWILVLEKQLPLKKEWVYAAALLHDIGRGEEYRSGISHDEASVWLARQILPDCGFEAEEMDFICQAILGHRHEKQQDPVSLLAQVLQEADWRCRTCFHCGAQESCKWSAERKNRSILY